MKLLLKQWLIIFLSLFLASSIFAYSSWEKSPEAMLDDLKTNVQDTSLNKVGGSNKGIEGALTDVKDNSKGYIQWLVYAGGAVALILIIYNGLVVLTNFGDENKLAKSKKRFVSLLLWVVVLIGGFVIIKFILGFIWAVFN